MPFKNKEDGEKYRANYFQKNKVKIMDYRKEHIKQYRAYQRKSNTKRRKTESYREYQRRWKKEQYKRVRQEVLSYYSNNTMKCACCEENQIMFLSIDHINNDGAKHRREVRGSDLIFWLKRNNFPTGFQILCWNCNVGKRLNRGVCPHRD